MPAKKATREAKRRTGKPIADRLVDEALEETFPASDTPFFVGGGAEPGIAESDVLIEKEREQPARRGKH